MGIALVPYHEWLSLLQQSENQVTSHAPDDILRHNPAINLLDFFVDAEKQIGQEAMGVPRMDISLALQSSSTLKSAAPLDDKDVRGWLDYWKQCGFLAQNAERAS